MRRIIGQPDAEAGADSGPRSTNVIPAPDANPLKGGAGNCGSPCTYDAASLKHRRLGRLKARFFSRSALQELCITVAAYWTAYLVYLFAAQMVYSDVGGTAMANALWVIELEQSIGILWEPSWQEWAISFAHPLLGHGGVAFVFNWIYILSFAPLMGAISVAIYVTNRSAYRHYRRIFLISYGLAIVVFIAFPLAPPRLVPEIFLDTMAVFGPSGYGTREMGRFYNVYAAMPSLHFGWTLVFGVFFLRITNKLAKVCGVIYPALMLLAVIVTGNHYIIDAIGGGLVVLVAFILVELHLWQRLIRWAEKIAI